MANYHALILEGALGRLKGRGAWGGGRVIVLLLLLPWMAHDDEEEDAIYAAEDDDWFLVTGVGKAKTKAHLFRAHQDH